MFSLITIMPEWRRVIIPNILPGKIFAQLDLGWDPSAKKPDLMVFSTPYFGRRQPAKKPRTVQSLRLNLPVRETDSLLTVWRAGELLAHPNIKIWDQKTIDLCLTAARSNPTNTDAVDRVRQMIGEEAYRIVMTSVPSLLPNILGLLQHYGFKPPLAELTTEVAAGRLPWTSELRDLGVLHPEDIRARHDAKVQFLAPYKPWTTAYLADLAEVDESTAILLQQDLDDILVQAAFRGIDQDSSIPDQIPAVWALAFIREAALVDSQNKMLGLADHFKYLQQFVKKYPDDHELLDFAVMVVGFAGTTFQESYHMMYLGQMIRWLYNLGTAIRPADLTTPAERMTVFLCYWLHRWSEISIEKGRFPGAGYDDPDYVYGQKSTFPVDDETEVDTKPATTD